MIAKMRFTKAANPILKAIATDLYYVADAQLIEMALNQYAYEHPVFDAINLEIEKRFKQWRVQGGAIC